MKKAFFMLSFLLFMLLPLSECLLSETPSTNFTLNGTLPKKIVLESSGSKFLTWNIDSQITLYSISGSVLCNTTYPQQIQKIIWPTEYYPILLPFPGLQFVTLNETDCSVIKTFIFRNITNMTNSTQEILEMSFIWRNGGGRVALSGIVSIYEIELSSASMVNAYLTGDLTGPRYQTTIYSKDFKYIYVVMTDANTGVRTVRVFKTETLFLGKPILELPFSTSVSSMTPSNDNSSIICVGSSSTTDGTSVYRFDNNGVLKTKTTKTGVIKSLTIGNGNTVVMFQAGKGTLDLVRAGDGKTIQNTTFSSSNYFLDGDFQKSTLIILDSSNRVLTYSYTPDDDVIPQDPVDPGKSSPVWIIVVSVIVGVLVLAVILLYVFRQKLPLKVREKLPKCFKKKTDEGKQPLLGEENKKQNIQPKPNHQPSNVGQQPPFNYPKHSSEYQQSKGSFQEGQRQKDGIPPGLTDAEIMEAMRKEEERRKEEELERRRRKELLEREERQRKWREEQEERKRKQYEYKKHKEWEEQRRMKEWEEQQRLMEIERRRREDYERERRREEMERLELLEKMRREEQARKYYEYQKKQEERKRIEMENKRLQEIRKIEYQRYLDEQDRRKYPPYSQYQPQYSQYGPNSGYQPNPQYSPNSQYPNYNNSNSYVPPQPQPQPQPGYNPPPYNSHVPIPPREVIAEPQKKDFVDERKNLIGREEKPDAIEEIENEDELLSKSFFKVKKKDDLFDSEIANVENEFKQ